MASIPTTAEVTTPIASVVAGTSCGRSRALSSTAPSVIGVASRNEKRAALMRESPAARPAVMVTPERETPGTSASACANPRPSATPHPGRAVSRPGGRKRSAAHSRKPNTISITAWSGSERSACSAALSSSLPATAPGTVASASHPHSRQASPRRAGSRANASRSSCHQSRANASSRASSVPPWSATSNATPEYFQPSRRGIRYRWALLETGRNSVRPWTAPSTAARTGVRVLSASAPEVAATSGIMAAHASRGRRS